MRGNRGTNKDWLYREDWDSLFPVPCPLPPTSYCIPSSPNPLVHSPYYLASSPQPPAPIPYPLVPSPRSPAPGPQPPAPAWGFTLLELLVVMVLLGVLTAVAYPSIGRGMSTLRLRTASRQIAAAIHLARSKALREQQTYYLQFDIKRGKVDLSSEDQRYQHSFSLPEGIVIRNVALPGEENESSSTDRAYYFAPNGLGENLEVRIANSHGRQMRIIQSSMVGSPRIEEGGSD